MRENFKYVIYAAVLLNLVLVISTAKQPDSLLFITSVIALLSLIADTWLTLKGNLPINDMINSWQAGKIPADWETYRTKWLQIFQYRQVINIAGFVSLVAGVVFGRR